MPGQFTAGARPPLPGAYFDFEVAQPQPQLSNTLGTVAVPFTHPWGPAGQVIQLNSFADFITYFGTGGVTPPSYSPGYIAVRQAFTGEGLPGRGGAGTVLAYRMVGSSGQAATLQIQNTTPASALRLTAVYQGSYGNLIGYTNTANAINPSTQSDLSIWVNGALAETFTYNNTDITGLAAAINSTTSGSKWVTATMLVTGVALGVQATPVSLTTGNDGSTLVSGDWTNAMTAFGTQRFSLFAPFDLEDSTILASLVTWAQGLNQNGKRFMTVVGGGSSDTSSAAASRSASINDPNFVNIGVGTYTDSVLGTLNTAQLAPRLAGIMAARGAAGGLSFARLAGETIVSGPSDSAILASISAGWMSLGRDSNTLAPVRFEKGVTTFTTANDAHRPLSVYSNPKFVRTMQIIENRITEWAEFNVIGLLPVDDNTVQYVLGFAKAYFKSLESDRVIQPGWTIMRSTNPAPTPQDDFIAVAYSVSFARDTEQILNTVTIS